MTLPLDGMVKLNRLWGGATLMQEVNSSASAAAPPRIPGYSVLGLVGCGGMGEVFLARQDSLGRLVAIKFVRLEDRDDSGDMLARFRDEARLMGHCLTDHLVGLTVLA